MMSMKFRVLAGKHSERGRIWMRGQVIETTTDLASRFNGATVVRQKFERVPDGTPADPGVPVDQFTDPEFNKSSPSESETRGVDLMATYESMSVEELRQVASQEEIELGKAKTKPEILNVLRSALSVPA